jgi:TonB family protein
MKVPLLALFMWLTVAAQTESFQNRAISAAQQVSALSLDARLPNRPFVAWFNEVVGQRAGVVWQLSECDPGRAGQDAPACAEVSAVLANGDTVIIGISVGTFKQGLIGKPAFQGGAVIKNRKGFYQIHRLSDLPLMLRTLRGVPRASPDLQTGPLRVETPPPKAYSRALPDLQTGPLRVETLPPTAYMLLASLGPGNDISAPEFQAPDEAPPPPPSPRRSQQNGESPSLPSPRRSQQNSGELVDAIVIKKTKPIYPAGARIMGVSGNVEVKIVISESGRVIEATAVSGHVALRAAAEDAARQWVYKPATLAGVPMKTEGVLTFTFTPGDQ